MTTVRELRLEAGVSQSELARRSGVAQPNIAAYETGRRRPSAQMLDRLRAALRPRPSEALSRHRDDVLAILARYGMSRPHVFGSVARGDDEPGSDVDLLVDVTKDIDLLDLIDAADELEKLLRCSVDIIPLRALRPEHGIRRGADTAVTWLDEVYGAGTTSRLGDVVSACRSAERLAARGRNWYDSDPELHVPRLAAGSLVLTLAEAVQRLPEVFLTERHSDPAWRRAIGMRSRLAHEYDAVDHELVWGVVSKHAAELRRRVHDVLTSDDPTSRGQEGADR